jgi:hypothetical protein
MPCFSFDRLRQPQGAAGCPDDVENNALYRAAAIDPDQSVRGRLDKK